MKNKRGITLIALIITIIVLLILAGVSINAIVGDNGIITNAQNASIKQSEAEITEFLQELYINEQTKLIGTKNDANSTPLQLMLKKYSNYFYNPSKDGYGGYNFIYYQDKDGTQYTLYFLRKSQLPAEIQKSIVGGNAVDLNGNPESYLAYSSLTDCYLISDDLKAYYQNGELVGDLKADTQGGLRVAYESGSSFAKLLKGDSTTPVTLQDALVQRELTIKGSDNILDLSELYALNNLTKLTLTNYKGSLKGIENARKLKYLYINNRDGTTNIDYKGIEGAIGLSELYFYMPTNDEVKNMCNAMSGTDYLKLETFGLYGFMADKEYAYIQFRETEDVRSELTTLESLDKLSLNTKNSVKILYIQNNQLSNLTGIENFTKIQYLVAYHNNLKNINAITNFTNLINLKIYDNGEELSDLTPLENITTLTGVHLDGDSGITNLIPIISNGKKITILSAIDNGNLDFSTSDWTAEMMLKLGGIANLNIDSKYSLLFTNKSVVTIASTITSSEFAVLKGNAYVGELDVSGNKLINDDTLQDVLPSLPNLKILKLNSTNIESLDWCLEVSDKTKLQKLYLGGTSVNSINALSGFSNLYYLSVGGNNLILYKEDDEEYTKTSTDIINSICELNNKNGGFMPVSEHICDELSKLTDLTYFGFYWGGTLTKDLDLTNTNLKRICCNTWYEGLKWIKLPDCIEEIDVHSGTRLKLSTNKNIKSISLTWQSERIEIENNEADNRTNYFFTNW